MSGLSTTNMALSNAGLLPTPTKGKDRRIARRSSDWLCIGRENYCFDFLIERRRFQIMGMGSRMPGVLIVRTKFDAAPPGGGMKRLTATG